MRDPNDPSVKRFEVYWTEPGPLADWTTGWFWWRGYGTPAYATMNIGEVGDITFPITCRWQDGYFYQMYFLRYDRAREAVDLIHQEPGSQEFNLDGDSAEATDIEIDIDEFSPDMLFSQLASILDVAQLTVEQAAGNTNAEQADRPADDDVWIAVDVGQESVGFATDDEVGR